MQWFVNDLSLDGQFNDIEDFRIILEPLLKLRNQEPLLRQNLFCSRTIGTRPVTYRDSFCQAILSLVDRDFKSLTLNWINKNGPFWDDNRQDNPDDYFECQEEDVTDQGIGEAARRFLDDQKTEIYSFVRSRFNFETSPLTVLHGFPEDPLDVLSIENHWEIKQLREALRSAQPEAQNWKELLEYVEDNFRGLIIPFENIYGQISPYPINRVLVERIKKLLRILNNIVEQTNVSGSLTTEGVDLFNKYFIGQRALFTDESASNKHKFRELLTFSDPVNHSRSIFCPWHGKIRSPQFRIHFEWPRPQGQRQIKVLYIGPKITKK